MFLKLCLITAGLMAACFRAIVARTKVHRYDRRQLAIGQRITPPPITGTVTSIAASQAQVVFPVAMVIGGVPQYSLSSGGGFPTAMTITSPTTIALTYGTTIATKTLTIPANEPNVRSFQGGFVAPATKTF